MSIFNKDEEWGFFVDLEINKENEENGKNKKIKENEKITRKFLSGNIYKLNNLYTIYEEDYWCETSAFDCEYEDEPEPEPDPESEINQNEKTGKKTQTQTIVMYIYCILCASFIYCSII
jgi:hypothetical protein